VKFETRDTFHEYLQTANKSEICGGVEVSLNQDNYSIVYHHAMIPNSDEPSFEQGSIIPKKFSGYRELLESRISLFTASLS
jgi:hypothetical protein